MLRAGPKRRETKRGREELENIGNIVNNKKIIKVMRQRSTLCPPKIKIKTYKNCFVQ